MDAATPTHRILALRNRLLSKYMMILKTPAPRMATDTLYLSSMDQNTVRVYTQTLLCFPFPDGNQAEAAITALTGGLRETLKRFPFLAGTLRLTESGGKLCLTHPTEIADPRETGILAKKTISSADFCHTYEQLRRMGMPPSAFKAEVFRPDDLANYPGIPANGEGIVDFSKSDAPVLRVQANFIPGGLVLSTYYHHAVMDCSGVHHFWQWFAHNVSTINQFSAGMMVEPEISAISPDQSAMRRDLDTRIPPPAQGQRPTAEAYIDGTYAYEKTLPEGEPCSLRYFVIPAKRIRDFRESLRCHFPPSTPPTICNVLAALVWIHVTRARASRLGPDNPALQETSIGIATDLRRRMDPPLNPDYMGNLAPFVKGSTNISDFTAEKTVSDETVIRTIQRIKATIGKVNNDWAQKHLTFFKSIEEIKDTECALGFRFGLDIYITSWMNFGADTQWGIPGTNLCPGSLHGRPDYIRRTYGPSDGGMMIMPRRRSLVDGKEAPYEVMVRLATVDMKTLLNQENGLSKWAERIID